MLMSFFAFINIYCLRVNLSVALVAMVNTTYTRQLQLQLDNDDVMRERLLAIDNVTALNASPGVHEIVCQEQVNRTRLEVEVGLFERNIITELPIT